MSVFSSTDACTRVIADPDALCSLENVPYGYVPTLWLSATLLSVFGFLLLATLALALTRLRTKTGYTLLLAVACCGEVAGWGARVRSSLYPFDSQAYIAQVAALIISPVFVTAMLYWQLELFVKHIGASQTLVKPKILLCVLIGEACPHLFLLFSFCAMCTLTRLLPLHCCRQPATSSPSSCKRSAAASPPRPRRRRRCAPARTSRSPASASRWRSRFRTRTSSSTSTRATSSSTGASTATARGASRRSRRRSSDDGAGSSSRSAPRRSSARS